MRISLFSTLLLELITITSGIYCIRNKINNKRYVGRSFNIEKRLYDHFRIATSQSDLEQHKWKLYKAIKKYGTENFDTFILETIEDLEKQKEREVYWVSYFDSYKNGYNSTPGGDHFSSKNHSPEVEAQRKETLKLNKSLMDENHPRAKLSNEEVIKIRQRYIEGEEVISIYQDYKLLYSSKDSFSCVVFNESYQGIEFQIPKNLRRNKGSKKLTNEQVSLIRKDYRTNKNFDLKYWANEFSLSKATIQRIIKGKTYKDVE